MSEQIVSGDVITIDNDMWADVGRKFTVHQAKYKEGTTAVVLHLEDASGEVIVRTLPANQLVKVTQK